MNRSFHSQYITNEHRKRVLVVLSMQQWQQFIDELEDIRLYDALKARNKSTISPADYKRKRQQMND